MSDRLEGPNTNYFEQDRQERLGKHADRLRIWGTVPAGYREPGEEEFRKLVEGKSDSPALNLRGARRMNNASVVELKTHRLSATFIK
jgi:hypothetical protein